MFSQVTAVSSSAPSSSVSVTAVSSSKDGSESENGKEGKVEYNINGTRFEVDARYEIHKAIGYGAYGFVVSATDKLTGNKVAIKKVPKLFHDLVDGKRILREIVLLKQLSHENVIGILDILEIRNREDFKEVYIVTQLMDTDLHHVIRSKQKLTTEHIQYFTYQLLRGLKYIHSARVLHRDLKPGNILVNGNCELRICDFGLARGFVPDEDEEEGPGGEDPEKKKDSADYTTYVVTRWYRAPELLLMCNDYTDAIDIWSVGCILGELINRKPLFCGRDYLSQLQLIMESLGKPTPADYAHVTHKEALRYMKQMKQLSGVPMSRLFPTATELELDILSKMLVFNPAKRISAAEALQHPYFSQLHDPVDEPIAKEKFHFEYDNKDISAEELRDMIFEQSQSFHAFQGK